MKTQPEVLEHQLRHHGLKVTAVRMAVLEIFNRSKASLSQPAIEKKLGAADRVTIYRTLRDMEAAGIVHKVISASGESKFALCAQECSGHSHDDNHIHFTCSSCDETYCLTDHKPRNITLPAGFQIEQVHVIVSGVCQKCAA